MDRVEFLTSLSFLGGRKLRKLTIAVTYACNLKCTTCNIWELYRKEPLLSTKELSAKEWKQVIANTPSVRYVSITGGEPSLRRDLPEITRWLGHHGVRLLSINTNGALPERIVGAARRFKESGGKRVRVHVSLMGSPELDRIIRGTGSFDSAVNAVQLLKDAKIPVYLEITLSPYNLPHIEEVLNTAEVILPRNRIIITFYNVAPYYRNVGSKERLKGIKEISKQLLERRGWSFETTVFLNIAKRFPEGTTRFCPAGKTSVFIDPYGNVYPCILRGEKLGNIRESGYDLYKILERSKDAVKEIRSTCKGCLTPCETMTGFASHPWRFMMP